MRLSDQMRRILLVLLKAERDPESAGISEFSRGIRGGNRLSLKEIVRLVEGDKAFYANGQYPHPKHGESYRRSLKRLRELRLVARAWTATRRLGYVYYFTDEGRAKAEKVHDKVVRYIREWRKLI